MENNGKNCLSDNKFEQYYNYTRTSPQIFFIFVIKGNQQKICYFLAQGYGSLLKKNLKSGLSQDWLELVRWFWNEFLQLVNAFFIAIMSMTLHSNKLETSSPKNSFSKFFLTIW